MTRSLLVAIALIGGIRQAGAAETIFWGSRAGQVTTVVSKSGVNTAKAVGKIKLTRANAIQHCTEYGSGPHPGCIKDNMEPPYKNHRIKANCITGEFTDLYDSGLVFKDGKIFTSTGQELLQDAATAISWRYDVAIDAIHALCPRKAKRAWMNSHK